MITAGNLTLQSLDLERWGGTLNLRSNIHPGKGFGSSTADVVATIRSVADAFGVRLPAQVVAQIAVAAESASDCLMFEHPVLFAQTDGIVLDSFAQPLPAFSVIGFSYKSPRLEVDTLAIDRPNYSRGEIDAFDLLRSGLARAIATSDPDLLGAVASGSTRIHLNHHPHELLESVVDGYAKWDALGVQVAHSGTVAGVLTRIDDPLSKAEIADALEKLTGSAPWVFDVEL